MAKKLASFSTKKSLRKPASNQNKKHDFFEVLDWQVVEDNFNKLVEKKQVFALEEKLAFFLLIYCNYLQQLANRELQRNP